MYPETYAGPCPSTLYVLTSTRADIIGVVGDIVWLNVDYTDFRLILLYQSTGSEALAFRADPKTSPAFGLEFKVAGTPHKRTNVCVCVCVLSESHFLGVGLKGHQKDNHYLLGVFEIGAKGSVCFKVHSDFKPAWLAADRTKGLCVWHPTLEPSYVISHRLPYGCLPTRFRAALLLSGMSQARDSVAPHDPRPLLSWQRERGPGLSFQEAQASKTCCMNEEKHVVQRMTTKKYRLVFGVGGTSPPKRCTKWSGTGLVRSASLHLSLIGTEILHQAWYCPFLRFLMFQAEEQTDTKDRALSFLRGCVF